MNYSSPITISAGGTYSGKWASYDSAIPVIKVRTSSPVTINASRILGAGTLIDLNYPNCDVTVTNTQAIGISGKNQGAFIDGDGIKRLVVENNVITGTIGIYLAHCPTLSTRIRYNTATNLDGRISDGNYGYNGSVVSKLVQFNQVTTAYAEIAWNYVRNYPYYSLTEDVISMYKTYGTSTSPITIHDNLIWGSYPAKPLSDDFSGGGIMLGDDGGGYIKAYNNTVIDTVNYGIGCAGGHDIEIYKNTVISAGFLPTGQVIKAQNVGVYLWNMYKLTDWANVSAHDNTIGWNGPSGRNDLWNASGTVSNNISLPSPITSKTEAQYAAAWWNSVNTQKLIVG